MDGNRVTLGEAEHARIRALFFRLGVSMGQMDAATKGTINLAELRTAMVAMFEDMHDLGDLLHATDRVRLGEQQGGKT